MVQENPFKAGTAVEGRYFTNREQEIRQLLIDLRSGQNVIVASPRRYGKTSLILETFVFMGSRRHLFQSLFGEQSKPLYSYSLIWESLTSRQRSLLVGLSKISD